MDLMSGASTPLDGNRLGGGEFLERPADALLDGFTSYEELALGNGLLLRRYANGAVRLENPTSGVIQEERIDGKLLVSLPNGKVVFQKFIGEPLLVYDTAGIQPPGLARVSTASLPGEEEMRHVYHFQDQEGAHIIDLCTLRYYRMAGKVSR